MSAIGYEPHPFFARIARAKTLGNLHLDKINETEATILEGLNDPLDTRILPDTSLKFLEKLFPNKSLQHLLGAREFLHSRGLAEDPLAFLLLSRTLELSTHSQTDGIYKAPTSKKNALTPERAFNRVIDMVRTDTFATAGLMDRGEIDIFEKSSEQMSEVESESVSIVVTSPPYLNNFDFAEMTRMYFYFWGIASSWSEITDRVRNKLVTNTTTALKGHKDKQDYYRSTLPPSVHEELDEIVYILSKAKLQKAAKKDYDFLVYPYFSQINQILSECKRCLCKSSPIHIMVADAALYGVHIPTPQVLSTLMNEIGFLDVRCEFVRKRGHRWILDKREGSKRGLGEYHVSATS